MTREEFLELLPGIEQPTHHCPNRNTKCFRNFTIGQSALDVQDEGLPLGIGQPGECGIDRSPQVGTFQTGICRWCIIRAKALGRRIEGRLRHAFGALRCRPMSSAALQTTRSNQVLNELRP